MLSVQRKKYEQLGDNRTFATVRVLAPDNLMRGMWQLLWTTKRERELRQFHSQMAIDPLNNRSYLEPNDESKSTLVASCYGTDADKGYSVGQFFSVTQFSLPPFCTGLWAWT